MSDRSGPGMDQLLAAALDDLSTAIRFPARPAGRGGGRADPGSATLGVVVEQPSSRPPPPGSRPCPRRCSALLVAGVAGAIGIGIGAIQIRFADGTPLPTPVASVLNRGFGEPTTLAAAEAHVPFDVRVPSDPALGDPDAVYLAAVPDGGTVTLVWGDRPGFPADEDGIGLVVTEFRADIGPETFGR